MKKHKLSIILIVAIIVMISVSCKKDEADKKSQIVYDGTEYELSKGYLVNYDSQESSGSYYFSLTLGSSEVNLDNYGSMSGIGNGIFFDLYSTSATDLVEGIYTFDKDTRNANTFNFGGVALNYDMSTLFNKSTSFAKRVISGTITVSKSETDYEISFEGTIEGGVAVTAYYKGLLTPLTNSGIVK
jgi:hypothetical protein